MNPSTVDDSKKRGTAGIPSLGYVRVSGASQSDRDGPQRQRDRIKCFARKHGYDVIETFQDLGVSGTTDLDDRLGLAELLDRIDSNGIKTVLIERGDRLARDLVVGEIILAEFRKRDVDVISADGNVNLTENDDPTSALTRQIINAIGEYERKVLCLRMQAARNRIRKAGGRAEGVAGYGTEDAAEARWWP